MSFVSGSWGLLRAELQMLLSSQHLILGTELALSTPEYLI